MDIAFSLWGLDQFFLLLIFGLLHRTSPNSKQYHTIFIYSKLRNFIKKIEYHHLILSLRHFVNQSNTKWIQSKSFPFNTNYDHYANIQGAAHINNSKLKHKAYEDIDTIITMPSIQPKKMLCQVAELELDTINGQKSTLLLFSTHMT